MCVGGGLCSFPPPCVCFSCVCTGCCFATNVSSMYSVGMMQWSRISDVRCAAFSRALRHPNTYSSCRSVCSHPLCAVCVCVCHVFYNYTLTMTQHPNYPTTKKNVHYSRITQRRPTPGHVITGAWASYDIVGSPRNIVSVTRKPNAKNQT